MLKYARSGMELGIRRPPSQTKRRAQPPTTEKGNCVVTKRMERQGRQEREWGEAWRWPSRSTRRNKTWMPANPQMARPLSRIAQARNEPFAPRPMPC
eukprot:8614912-Alexandrium_andersonii.AAC.1